MSDTADSQPGAVQAVILAGGVGRRLRPYTELIPKPLVPIAGIPVIEIVLRQLGHFGFRRVTITLGHEAELIRAHCSDGSYLGLDLDYSIEDTPLGTAGPLAAIPGLAEQFLVLNGDLITTFDYRSLYAAHCASGALLTIAAHERTIPIEFGIIKGEDGVVGGYIEKPSLLYRVSMGIYAFNRAVLAYITPGERLDFPNLVIRLLEAGQPVRYHPFDGYWLDIGSSSDFEKALDEFPTMRPQLLHEKE